MVSDPRGGSSGDTLREKFTREGSGVIFTVKVKAGGVWIQHGVKHHMKGCEINSAQAEIICLAHFLYSVETFFSIQKCLYMCNITTALK